MSVQPKKHRSLRLLLGSIGAALALVLAASSPTDARADEPAPQVDPAVARLLAVGHSMKWNAVPQGKGTRYGHAEALIAATPERVMQIVTAYGQYKDLVPEKFRVSRIIGKDVTGTDLYVQVPLKGPLPIVLTSVLHFTPPTHGAPNATTVEGKFMHGTFVRDANVMFTVKQVSSEVSLLQLDLLILPTIPATQGMIDEELRDAAMQAIDAIHDKAQGNNLAVTAVATK